MTTYTDFVTSKLVSAESVGFTIPDSLISEALFPFQRDIVAWALTRGRAAIFADCGLGKTPMQLEWARHVHLHTGLDVLILAPLAVAEQTRREGDKFGIPVTVCRTQADVRPGVNVANYEMLAHFTARIFAAFVEDALRSLTARQAYVLTGLARGQTLAEVGRFLGLTGERVRQMRNEALADVREYVVRALTADLRRELEGATAAGATASARVAVLEDAITRASLALDGALAVVAGDEA